MDLPAIIAVFVGSLLLLVGSFALHARLAPADPEARAGGASMAAFVAGWLGVITAVITGSFLVLVLLGR